MKKGFTIIELLFATIFLVAAGVIFFIQKNEIAAKARDDQRKIAINSIHHNLEQVFYKNNQFYPEIIDEKTLPTVEPQTFTDPQGVNINNLGSDYRYEPTNCKDGKCQSYTLRADLEKQDDFIKKSRN